MVRVQKGSSTEGNRTAASKKSMPWQLLMGFVIGYVARSINMEGGSDIAAATSTLLQFGGDSEQRMNQVVAQPNVDSFSISANTNTNNNLRAEVAPEGMEVHRNYDDDSDPLEFR